MTRARAAAVSVLCGFLEESQFLQCCDGGRTSEDGVDKRGIPRQIVARTGFGAFVEQQLWTYWLASFDFLPETNNASLDQSKNSRNHPRIPTVPYSLGYKK